MEGTSGMPYKTEVKYTYEEARKAFWATQFYKNKAGIAAAAVAVAIVICFIINGTVTNNYENVVIFSLVLILYPILTYIFASKRVKKNYESYKMIHGNTFSYAFYEDYMESDGEKGKSKIQYCDLYKIVETKTNIYLFISSGQAFFVVKSDCSNELIAFLQKLKKEVGNNKNSKATPEAVDFEQLSSSLESRTDIIHKARVEWGLNEIKDFNWLLIKNEHKSLIYILVLVEVMFFAAFAMSFPAHSMRLAVESILLVIAVPLLLYILFNFRCRKNYESNKMLRNFAAIITFDNDKLEQISNVGSLKANYDEIYRIFETDNNFYILVSDNQAINVRKANCSNEMVAFLKELKSKVA